MREIIELKKEINDLVNNLKENIKKVIQKRMDILASTKKMLMTRLII